MLKPLSEKTLRKKYDNLGLPEEVTDLLHKYFLCFSNLYGMLSVREAWELFREYEGLGLVHKSEFYEFSEIAQRELQPYKIIDLDEIYKEEENCSAGDRYIITDFLILSGYYKFRVVWDLDSTRNDDVPFYLPPKEELFQFTEDRFWKTKIAIKMKSFVENLKSDGQCRSFTGGPLWDIKDVDGNSVTGKCAKDIVMFTRFEQYDVEHESRQLRKERLIAEYTRTVAEKIEHSIENNIMCGDLYWGPAKTISYLIESMSNEYGVTMTMDQAQEFLNLYMELNNTSNLWINWGWSPEKLGGF